MLGLLAGCHVCIYAWLLPYKLSTCDIVLGHTIDCLLQVLVVWTAYA